MKTKIRILTMMVCLLFVFFVFVGCTSNPTSTPSAFPTQITRSEKAKDQNIKTLFSIDRIIIENMTLIHSYTISYSGKFSVSDFGNVENEAVNRAADAGYNNITVLIISLLDEEDQDKSISSINDWEFEISYWESTTSP